MEKKSRVEKIVLVSVQSLLFVSLLMFSSNQAAAQTLTTSSNWSGYVMQDGHYTGVEASWVVPQVSPTSSISQNAEWVGIGGKSTHDLIQAGTMATITNGSLSYKAWLETLPNEYQNLSLEVKSGDSVSVSLKETQPNIWALKFSNETTGKEFSQNISYVSSHSSVEWIEELPIMIGASPSLSNFSTVHFTNGQTTESNSTLHLIEGKATALSMVAQTSQVIADRKAAAALSAVGQTPQVIAAPGSIDGNGGFDVQRLNSPALAH